MEKIDFFDAIDMIETVVRGNESHVYQKHHNSGLSCHYVWDGSPDCIVGHVLVNVGVDVEDLAYGSDRTGEHGKYSMGSALEVLELLAKDGVVEFSDDARVYLNRVQTHQDSDKTWRESADLARAYMDGLFAGRGR